jgi:hypothetical protein
MIRSSLAAASSFFHVLPRQSRYFYPLRLIGCIPRLLLLHPSPRLSTISDDTLHARTPLTSHTDVSFLSGNVGTTTQDLINLRVLSRRIVFLIVRTVAISVGQC